jgi:carboxymethylenebutenolidase
MPDRAGVKTSWLTTGRLILKALPSLPRFIANRPSVVDARVQEVMPLQSAFFPLPMNLDLYSSSRRSRPRKVMKGLAPLGECHGIRASQAPANFLLHRYCFGGSMAARLGSTDSLNTIVIAHPGNLTHDQIRAIKVTHLDQLSV